MISDTQRQQKLRDTSTEIEKLYFSSESGNLMRQVFDKYLTDQTTFDSYIYYGTVIGDTILGFYHTKDLPLLLQKEVGVSAEVAQHIVADLAELLVPVLEREASEADPKKAGLKALQQQFGRPNPSPVTAPAEPISAVPTNLMPPTARLTLEESIAAIPKREAAPIEPAELHNVAPMRTMAADMNRVHGYGAYRQAAETGDTPVVQSASQEDLLKARPRLTNIPKVGE